MTAPEELIRSLKAACDNGGWLMMHQAAKRLSRTVESGKADFSRRVRLAVLASFTAEPLADYLAVTAALRGIGLELYIGGYNRIAQELLDPDGPLYRFAPDMTLVVVDSQSLPFDSPRDAEQALQPILDASELFTATAGGTMLMANVVNPPQWPLHPLCGEQETAVMQVNRRIDAFCQAAAGRYCLSLDRLAAYAGYRDAFCPEMMSMARCPFSESFLSLAAQKTVGILCAIHGWLRKCLVLDCDNTLWGGIIGEDGPEGISLGPDWPGREFLDFQKAILELYAQGVILAINSKNNPDDIMPVLQHHPHMLLREEHFAAIAANWNPKPDNMLTIADQINIGLDSLVFVDDNPAERELMRQTLAEVAIVELPDNPARYAHVLRQTNFFGSFMLTEEDRQRGRMYAAQRQRSELQKSALNLTAFLKSLKMVCTIRPAQLQDVKRITQLTQRTNQFNLTTRRYSEQEIRDKVQEPGWNVYVLGLKDKFGDNGTVGLAIVRPDKSVWHIETFLMSCRVIGRQAEDALVDYLCRQAVSAGADAVSAAYLPTAKNGLTAQFWDKMGFTQVQQTDAGTTYRLDITHYHPKTFEYLTYE